MSAAGQEVPSPARSPARDFVELDLAGRITRASPAYQDLLGYPEAALVGRELSEFESEPLQGDRLRAYVADLLAERRAASPYFASQRTREGRIVPVRIDPDYHRDASGTVAGLFLHVIRLGVDGAGAAERETKELLWAAIDGVPAAFFSINRAGEFTLAIAKGLERRGLKAQSHVGRSIFELYRDIPDIVAAARRVLAGESFTIVLEVYGSSFELRCTPLRDEFGQVVGAVGVSVDVTARIETERRLRESEERYRALAENAYDLIIEANRSEGAVYVSANARELTGYPPAELLGFRMLQRIHPEDRDRLRETLERVLDSGKPDRVAYRYRHRDGSWLWTECTARAFLTAAGETRLVVISRNITEHIRAEQRLAESERMLSTLLGNLPGMAYRLRSDRGWVTEFVSEGCAELTGYSAGHLVEKGRLFRAGLIHPDDREWVWSQVQAALDERQPFRIVYRLMMASGDEKWVSEQGMPVYAEDGTLEALEGFVADATDRIRAEEAQRRYAERLEEEVARRTRDLQQVNEELRRLQSRLIEAERLAATGELSGSIAHAISNPLAAALGTVEMKLESAPEPSPSDVRLSKLLRRIDSVVQGMLQFSRRGTLRPVEISPADVIQEVATALTERCEASRVALRTQAAPDLPKLFADGTLLTTALVSIAENSVEAMEEGGELRLDAEYIAAADAITFRISDSGPGIPANIRERIFEPFYTTKRRGSGLGLAIAHGIVRGHEGRIRIDDRPGGGTVMSVDLPRRRPALSTPSEAGASDGAGI